MQRECVVHTAQTKVDRFHFAVHIYRSLAFNSQINPRTKAVYGE